MEIAQENGIRVIGPNCFGIINTEVGLDLTFTFTRALQGPIAFISQSGAMCCGTLDWAAQQEIGFSKFINLGNKCDLDEADILSFLAEDSQTKVIAMYLEEIREGQKFLQIAKLVSKRKPIVALKAGTSDAGAKAVRSHTGSIAGSDVIVDAAFKQAGIIRTHDILELLDVSIALAIQPIPEGKNVGIVTNAGGLGVLTADWCSKLGLQIPALPSSRIKHIQEFLPRFASPLNPIDMTGSADYECYRDVLDTVMAERSIDCLIAIFVSQGLVTADGPARGVVKASKRHKKPVLAFWMGGASVLEGVRILRRNSIPVYPSPVRVARAAVGLTSYHYLANAVRGCS